MQIITMPYYIICDWRAYSWVTSKIIVEYTKIVKVLVKQIMQVGIPTLLYKS